MTGPADCGEIRHALGVYIVGAIDPAERAIVDAHLSHCPDCREELAGLAGLPALLGRVPAADVERMDYGEYVVEEPPAELLDSLLDQVAIRRRARRWRMVAAAAAAAVIAVGAGIAGGTLISNASGNQPSAPAAAQHYSYLYRGGNSATGVDAAVYYESPTNMMVQVTGVKPGSQCVFWVVTKGGMHVIAGTWTALANDSIWYHASSEYTPSQLRGFDVSVGNQILVKVPIS
jgi:predicted anti-sigma-YlaC factor YlaD